MTATASSETPLLAVSGLTVAYGGGLFSRTARTILHGIDLSVRRGEILALVGESGSGKSTILRAVTGLVQPADGDVRIDGTVVSGLSRRARKPFFRRLQMVFQDPYASLDPRLPIVRSVAEPLGVFETTLNGAALRARVESALAEVGLSRDALDRYPHEFSGGQRQRIAIARALIVSPEILLLDEPVSALDVSVRAQVLNLLLDLRRSRGLTYLFVSHDLAVVRLIADRVVVLSEGKIVESGETLEVIDRPRHPYTRALRAACPAPPGEGSRV